MFYFATIIPQCCLCECSLDHTIFPFLFYKCPGTWGRYMEARYHPEMRLKNVNKKHFQQTRELARTTFILLLLT